MPNPEPPRLVGAIAIMAALLLGGAQPARGADAFASAEAVKPLEAGSRVPSVQVRSVRGEPVDLAALVGDAGALLVFYRGGW